MSEPFVSPYFTLMPAEADVREFMRTQGIGTVREVSLFEFSSCTPAFEVLVADAVAGGRRLVLRGEQQNDLSVTEPEERSLEKEIWMLNRTRAQGVGVPDVYLDGAVAAIPGYGRSRQQERPFRFFLMEFAPGVAMDRLILGSTEADRCRLLNRVAEIYARIHAVEGQAYGVVDARGQPVAGKEDLTAFLRALLGKKARLVSRLFGAATGREVDRFVRDALDKLAGEIEKSGYRPKPRLVLYDGFAGNMLVEGETISMIDMALGGYFEAVTEFCAFIYPLKDMLFPAGRPSLYWTHFLEAYMAHGGVLPPPVVRTPLLHVMFVNLLLHNAVYCKESIGPDKQAEADRLMGRAARLMEAEAVSVPQLTRWL